MTGAELCRKLLTKAGIAACVVTGPANQYLPGEKLIVLRQHCYGGTSAKNLTTAAHEVGHAEQEHQIGWIAPAFRWLLIGRLVLEWDASRRARRMMAGDAYSIREDVLTDSWRGYLVPALWQTGLMLAVGVAALIWRKL